MSSKGPRRATPLPSDDPDVVELTGFADIGMSKEALRVARKILLRERPHVDAVRAAVETVLIHARRPAQWRKRIDELIARLPKRSRHHLREVFVQYFATIKDHERACEFYVAARDFRPETFYLGMDSFVALGRIEHARRALFQSRFTEEEELTDYAMETVAILHSATDHRAAAYATRSECNCDSPIAQNIVDNTVKSGLAILIAELDRRAAQLTKQRDVTGISDIELSVPGVDTDVINEAIAECRRWRAKLIRLVPRAELHLFCLTKSPNATRQTGDTAFPEDA